VTGWSVVAMGVGASRGLMKVEWGEGVGVGVWREMGMQVAT